MGLFGKKEPSPFQQGQAIGQELVEDGYLEATSLNSENQRREDAQLVAVRQTHVQEQQREMAAGIMSSWQQSSNNYYCGLCGKKMPLSHFPH